MYINELNIQGLEFQMKVKDIPKFEKLNTQSASGAIGNLKVNAFELINGKLTPILNNKNYLQPQIDLLLFENH